MSHRGGQFERGESPTAMRSDLAGATAVFAVTLAATYIAAGLARRRAAGADEDLAGRSLNRWLVGLSAGTTGNSGFVVTGAVGLGYSGGVHWLLLPLSWLLGDLVYWSLFPQRLNAEGRRSGAATLSELLTDGLSGRLARTVSVAVAILLVTLLSTYTAAQWLAGKKFLSGVFNLSEPVALTVFGATIVIYSALGGFRGSVYADAVQAVIRILGTLIALVAVSWLASGSPRAVQASFAAAGPAFLSFAPSGGWIALAGFVIGYAAAAIGFGLGQPQIVSRYLAGASPDETRAAKWIYIGFLQGTWLAMTLFGVLLRGVMPGLADPETGLSVFFQAHMPAIVTGVIFADVFATIASTSNGILVAVSQTLTRNLLPARLAAPAWAITLAIGLATIALSFVLPGDVFSIALGSVSLIASALAGPVMIRLFHWRHSGATLLGALLAGLAAGLAWKLAGFDGALNESAIGLAASLAANSLLAMVLRV